MQGAAFTPDAMDAYLPRVVATCEAYLQQWASQDKINLVPAVRHITRSSNLQQPGFHLNCPHMLLQSHPENCCGHQRMNHLYLQGTQKDAACMQMGELAFDFAEGLVVGLGIEGEEKAVLSTKWRDFTSNAVTFTVLSPLSHTRHNQRRGASSVFSHIAVSPDS